MDDTLPPNDEAQQAEPEVEGPAAEAPAVEEPLAEVPQAAAGPPDYGEVAQPAPAPLAATATMAPPPPPAPPAATATMAPPPPPGAKPKMNWGFFVLGALSPFVIVSAIAVPLNFLNIGVALGLLVGLLPWAVFFLFLYLFLRGRRKGDPRLRSYGLGGMWAYIVIPLTALIATGTCLITGQGFGG